LRKAQIGASCSQKEYYTNARGEKGEGGVGKTDDRNAEALEENRWGCWMVGKPVVQKKRWTSKGVVGKTKRKDRKEGKCVIEMRLSNSVLTRDGERR